MTGNFPPVVNHRKRNITLLVLIIAIFLLLFSSGIITISLPLLRNKSTSTTALQSSTSALSTQVSFTTSNLSTNSGETESLSTGSSSVVHPTTFTSSTIISENSSSINSTPYWWLTSPNSQYSGDFGESVASNSDMAIVGAPGELIGPDHGSPGLNSYGRAYIYNASTGELLQVLTSPNPQGGQLFGWAVAINSELAVVGAPLNGLGSGSGNVYVFNVTNGKLIADIVGAAGVNGFASRLALSGDFVLVNNITQSFAAFSLYNAVSGSLIREIADPTYNFPPLNNGFGESVAMSGDLALVGSLGIRSPDGFVYVFNVTTGEFVKNITSPPGGGVSFGSAVALEGDLAIVGSYSGLNGIWPDDSSTGTAYLFNATTGQFIRNITTPVTNNNHEEFGFSVAISPKYAVIGSFLTYFGVVYVYNVNNGELIQNFTGPNGLENGQFGSSISISGSVVVVGAPMETVGSTNAGRAYLFEVQ